MDEGKENVNDRSGESSKNKKWDVDELKLNDKGKFE